MLLNFKCFAVAGIIALLVLYVPQAIASFKSIDADFMSHNVGLVEIHDSIQCLNYDETQIDWHRQYNDTSDYWCCPHKVLNNEGGSANDKSDDYHLCHVYNSGDTAATNAFNTDLPIVVLDTTGEELFTISKVAGSSWGDNNSVLFNNSSGSIVADEESRLTISMNNSSEEGRNFQFGQGSQRERF